MKKFIYMMLASLLLLVGCGRHVQVAHKNTIKDSAVTVVSTVALEKNQTVVSKTVKKFGDTLNAFVRFGENTIDSVESAGIKVVAYHAPGGVKIKAISKPVTIEDYTLAHQSTINQEDFRSDMRTKTNQRWDTKERKQSNV